MSNELTNVITQLEERLRWAMQSIETLTSLTKLQDHVNTGQSINLVFQEASNYIKSLIPHKAIAFFIIDNNTAEFMLQDCLPVSMHDQMKIERDFLIQNGTFGWAINHNHTVTTVPSGGEGTLLMHVLATRTKVYGMYIGYLENEGDNLSSMTLDILSVIFANISMAIESHKTYNLIHRYNEQLEADIKTRTKDLETSQKKAEEANLAKNAFLANMSHTLKTPLNAIIGYSEMLIEDAQENNDKELEKDLNRINGAGKSLLTTIIDMLDYAKMEAGHITLVSQEFTVDEMTNALALEFKEKANENGNELTTDIKLDKDVMYADGTRIKQAISQLILNACKFTEKGKITLTVKNHLKGEKTWFQFSVCDTGIGIPSDMKQHLFGVFSQLDNSASKKFEGTGLGLAIAKFVAEGLGGNIQVESEEGKGSCFTLNIPDQEKLSD